MPVLYTGTPWQEPQRGRRRHRKDAVRHLHHARTQVQRRRDDIVDAEPLEPEHRADDVDDRVDGPDLVQVDLVDRHLVDCGLGFADPAKEIDRPLLARGRQRRLADELEMSASERCP